MNWFTPALRGRVNVAVLACAAIILAFVFRKNLRGADGQKVAALWVVVAVVGMPMLVRAVERIL